MLILSNIRTLYDGSSAGDDAVHERVDLVIDGERIVERRPHGTLEITGGDHRVVDLSESRPPTST